MSNTYTHYNDALVACRRCQGWKVSTLLPSESLRNTCMASFIPSGIAVDPKGRLIFTDSPAGVIYRQEANARLAFWSADSRKIWNEIFSQSAFIYSGSLDVARLSLPDRPKGLCSLCILLLVSASTQRINSAA